MPPVPTAQPDGPKIHQLIKERGGVTKFARKLGRHPQSIWDITTRRARPVASTKFIRQIAAELGVKPSEISDMPDEGEQEPERVPIPAAEIRKRLDARLRGDGKAA